MRNELDKALSASRPGGGSATFQQMLENLQMRYSGSGMGPMTGTGSGTSTGSGYSTQAPDPSSVYGNESLAAEGNQSSQDANQSGAGSGDLSNANNSATLAKPGSLDGLKDEERKTSSSTAESLFIEHDTLIDAYFKKITEAPE